MYKIKTIKQRQTGSSMIEVLVAVFILSIGLLGLASLQMVSLKNINNTQFQTLATTYAYDMAERMRSNRKGLSGYDNILSTVADPGCTDDCTPTQMAQLDAFGWNSLIQSTVINGGLPEGKGTVTKNGSVYEIEIKWKELQTRDLGDDDGGITLKVQI